MKKVIALSLAAAFSTASFALADSVTIKTDPEPTGSIVVKERQDPDVIIKKRKKIVIKEQDDPDVVIKGRVNID
jgi:hypothetical protein